MCLDGFIYFLQPARINPFSYKNMVRKSRLAEESELKLEEVLIMVSWQVLMADKCSKYQKLRQIFKKCNAGTYVL